MKLKIVDFKMKLATGLEELIDMYFSSNTMSERLINATVKIILHQNIDKMDDFLELFTDKNGHIDTDIIIREYTKAFGGDKFIIDLRDFINNDLVRNALPNKALAIKIDDVTKILNTP